jgi:hypothetical protein
MLASVRTAAIVLALLLLAGCSSGASPTVAVGSPAVTSPSASAAASPTIAPAPPGMTLMRDGSLHAATTYATAAFGVRFAITVGKLAPDRHWFASETALVHQLEIGDPDLVGVGVQFYLPTAAYDADGNEEPVPADFVDWLATSPHLQVVSKRDITVGGRVAVAVTVRVRAETVPTVSSLCHEKCVLVASTAPDAPFRPLELFASSIPWTVVVVDTDAGQLLISEESGSVQADAKKLVATLQFLP